MTAKLSFFPVGNGDMCLLELESGKKILVDVNIRSAADDDDDETLDVASELRDRLKRDTKGRLFVDVFALSHPDQDHCSGLCNHFHLGDPGDWSEEDDKIVINEIWSSPMVFRRASKNHALCNDAKEFNKEAKRRVKVFRDGQNSPENGDRILVLGKDENGKTDDLEDILIEADTEFSTVNGTTDSSVSILLVGPLPKDEDEEVEKNRSKNNSSIILRFSIQGDGETDKGRFLTGGDAEVAIWESVWGIYKGRSESLSYDILQAPHHCSWHSLSHDSWSKKGEDAEISNDARSALAQGRKGALIVASSNSVKDDETDPPCIRAKREYQDIAEDFSGEFVCVGERPNAKNPGVLVIEIGGNGPKLKSSLLAPATTLSSGLVGTRPIGHGN